MLQKVLPGPRLLRSWNDDFLPHRFNLPNSGFDIFLNRLQSRTRTEHRSPFQVVFAMLDFTTVTREFRGLVDRRRDIATFIGSGFAAMSLFLSNALEGKLPPSLSALQEHLFAFYALVLMVMSLILALRMARLHGGMVLNGILYARLMQNQSFTRSGNPTRSARHNYFGVSFIQFIMIDLIAAFATSILFLAFGYSWGMSIAFGFVLFVLWLCLYFRFHHQAVAFSMKKIEAEEPGSVAQADWKEHVSLCLQQANQGLLAEIAFAGLMVFSCFGVMSSLGKIEANQTDIANEIVTKQGPLFFSLLMLVTCFFELIIYLRIRVAIGQFSLQLDPTDKPFQTLKLTDSLMGYMLLAFLFVLSLHVTLILLVPNLGNSWTILLIDLVFFLFTVVAEQLTLIRANAHHRNQSVPT
jgi:hypothetical protein